MYSIANSEKLLHLFSARDVAFFGVGRFNDSKNSTLQLQFLLSFATSSLDVMFETTPHQQRFQVCGFTTKGSFSFKVSW